jgi:8-oxo-dGTP diphosphatase
MSNLEYLQSLPKKRMGSGVLVRNTVGAALIVVPTYKPSLEILGGIVEALESPKMCATREALEELGLELQIGRLLVIDYHLLESDEALVFVFDGGVLTDEQIAQIKLPEAELSSFRFVPRAELPQILTDRMARRLENAFVALETKQTLYLERGYLV